MLTKLSATAAVADACTAATPLFRGVTWWRVDGGSAAGAESADITSMMPARVPWAEIEYASPAHEYSDNEALNKPRRRTSTRITKR